MPNKILGNGTELSVEDVLCFAGRVQWILRLGVLILALGAIAFSVSLWLVGTLAHKNEQAIEVSCLLLRTTIIESGAANDPKAPPSDRMRLNELLIAEIIGKMDPGRQRRALALAAKVDASGQVTIPNCRQIAKHPQSVTAVAEESERKAAGSR